MITSAFLVAASGCATPATRVSGSADRPAPPIKLGEVILRDNFDKPDGGRLPKHASAPDLDQGYVDGEYFFRLAPSFKETFRAAGPDTVFANTHVEVDVRLVGGTEARWLGVACRVVIKEGDAAGAYVLAVGPATGWFALTRIEPGRMVRLVPDQFSEVVRRGNGSNHLELTCTGTTIIGRINGTTVASVQDGTLDNGYVTLVVSRTSPILLEAKFDNLLIHEALVGP